MRIPWSFVRSYGRAVGASASILTLGPWSPSGRHQIRELADAYQRWRAKVPALPQITSRDLLEVSDPLELREVNGGDGNVTISELAIVTAIVRQRRAQAVFEIGTFDGRTTLNIAANAPPDAVVYTLDLPREGLTSAGLRLDEHDAKYIDKPASGARFNTARASDVAHKIHQLWGDSATFDFSPYQDAMDLVFVDGSHAYEYILSDSKNAAKLLRHQAGTILWHDYGTPWWPGVTQALDELYLRGGIFAKLRHVAGTALACVINE